MREMRLMMIAVLASVVLSTLPAEAAKPRVRFEAAATMLPSVDFKFFPIPFSDEITEVVSQFTLTTGRLRPAVPEKGRPLGYIAYDIGTGRFGYRQVGLRRISRTPTGYLVGYRRSGLRVVLRPGRRDFLSVRLPRRARSPRVRLKHDGVRLWPHTRDCTSRPFSARVRFASGDVERAADKLGPTDLGRAGLC